MPTSNSTTIENHDGDAAQQRQQPPRRALARRHVVGRLERIELGPLGDLALDRFELRVVQFFFEQRLLRRAAGRERFSWSPARRST